MTGRIFIIGFNRCGTTSLHEFFQQAGLRSIHYDEGMLAVRMEQNARNGHPVMAGYEDYDVFSDMFYACVHGVYESNRYFREIAEQEPDAKFILNVRDVDAWVESRQYWHRLGAEKENDYAKPECRPIECRLEMVEATRRQLCCPDIGPVFVHWRAQWATHLDAVRRHLPSDRLMTFDIDRDDPKSLCSFAGLPDHYGERWAHHNRSLPASRWPVRLAGRIPRGVKARTPRVLKDMMRKVAYGLDSR